MARTTTRTKDGIRVTRHLKIGGGWTVHVEGKRYAWFLNHGDLRNFLRSTLHPKHAEHFIEWIDA